MASDYFSLSTKLCNLTSQLGMTPLGREKLRLAKMKIPRFRVVKKRRGTS